MWYSTPILTGLTSAVAVADQLIDMLYQKNCQLSNASLAITVLANACDCRPWPNGRYCLSDRSQRYNDVVISRIAKMERRLKIRFKLRVSYGSDQISMPSPLPVFQMASNTSGFHQRAAMWLSHFYEEICRSRLQSMHMSIQIYSSRSRGKTAILRLSLDLSSCSRRNKLNHRVRRHGPDELQGAHRSECSRLCKRPLDQTSKLQARLWWVLLKGSVHRSTEKIYRTNFLRQLFWKQIYNAAETRPPRRVPCPHTVGQLLTRVATIQSRTD